MTGLATAQARRMQFDSAVFANTIEPLSFRPLMSRREAEDLFLMDASKSIRNSDWEAYFVETLVEYVVHAQRPSGIISEADAEWLVKCFGDMPGPSVPALLRGLVAEAEVIPAILIGYALSCGAMRI